MYLASWGFAPGKPNGVPLISGLGHQGHITGSPVALLALSHCVTLPAPIFKRYEDAAVALYDGSGGSNEGNRGGGGAQLPPVPSNVSGDRKKEHNYARKAITAIYFNPDGSLMDEKPTFAYRNEVALWLSVSYENLNPAQVLDGIIQLQSMG